MELLRRPGVLAALAATVLVINAVVLMDLGDDDGSGDVPVAGEQPGDQEAAGTAAGPGDGGQAGTAADAAGGAAGDDGAGGDADGGQQAGGLASPSSGTYAYTSTGTWSLSGGGTSEQHPLPESATATVRADGGAWQQRLAAGDDYADDFSFAVADGGVGWTAWVLERRFESGLSTTSYTCSGDGPHYRPGEPGRVATHTCEGPGITSEGRIELVGREDVTLGDGTVVQADRLAYSYTVSGDGVGGQGQFALWLDPATGLRVKEVRSIATTTTGADGTTYDYREDVEFTLQSLQAG